MVVVENPDLEFEINLINIRWIIKGKRYWTFLDLNLKKLVNNYWLRKILDLAMEWITCSMNMSKCLEKYLVNGSNE
jgi:hypothetical protein